MKTKLTRWLQAALLAPLLAVYATNGCTANVMRDVASGLQNVANDIDGHNRNADFGDVLSNWVQDW